MGTIVDGIQSRVGDEAGGSMSRMRRLATPIEVAAYLHVLVKTLYAWRYEGKGPRAHRVGRHLRYRWEDVEAWLASAAARG
jgi:excisionase family DNA binding protein